MRAGHATSEAIAGASERSHHGPKPGIFSGTSSRPECTAVPSETDRCPVWCMMERSDAPLKAAVVACRALSECPAYLAGSRPARVASFFTTRATSIPLDRPGCTWPWRLMDGNGGPLLTPACSVYCIVRVGHPSGIGALRPPIRAFLGPQHHWRRPGFWARACYRWPR